MAWDKREIIGLLRLEIENIRERGLGACFRDTVLCINAGKSPGSDRCDQCLLLQFVPRLAREENIPCFHIPLNEVGETLASLAARAEPQERQAAVLAWMEAAGAQLQKELDAERAQKARAGAGNPPKAAKVS